MRHESRVGARGDVVEGEEERTEGANKENVRLSCSAGLFRPILVIASVPVPFSV